MKKCEVKTACLLAQLFTGKNKLSPLLADCTYHRFYIDKRIISD